MKKFIILISIITPSYGLCVEVLKPPCSNFFSQTERRPPNEQSANEMIQALIDYSGETREAPWIQKTIQLMRKKIQVEYPDSNEMQAILKFLEEKIGDKDQLLKVLELSPSFLIRLRKNSLNTHLRPLFKTLEDIFGQEIVLNKLKHSLKMIQLKVDKIKKIIDILKGQTPIPIFEDQRMFEINLNFNDEEIKNSFIKNLNIYTTSLESFIGSTSLKTGEYQKGIIQILWPFIKSFVTANLTTEEKNSLRLESDINSKTTKAIKELLLESSQLFTFKSTTVAEFFNVLMGKEKFLVTLNNQTTPLDLGFKEYEISLLILKNRTKFLRNNKEKLKSNIEILWPLIEAWKRKDLESQRDKNINQEDTINEALTIKNFFAQAPQVFTIKPTLLNELIKILTGKISISFPHDGETITLELGLTPPEIIELLLRDPQGFSQMSPQKLEFTIKTLWPFIKAFVEENLKSQRNSEMSQGDINPEIITNEAIKFIEKVILQSPQGFLPKLKSFEDLLKVLEGKISISFQSNGELTTLKLNFNAQEIARLFSNDPQGFSQMDPQKLELTIKTLWPFIKALAEKNLKSQRNSEISQGDINPEVITNEAIKIIQKALSQSIKGFLITLESLKNIIEILTGGTPISFRSNGELITLKLNIEASKIGQLFSNDPQGFSKMNQQKLEFTIKTLWPFIKAFVEENLKSQRNSEISPGNINPEIITNEAIKFIETVTLQSPQGFSPNPKFFTDLVEILIGKKIVSFQSGGELIELTIKIEDYKIAEFFRDNPQGFVKKGSQNLAKVFQNLWPSLKENSTTITEIENKLNQMQNLKPIIKKAFSY